MLRGRHPGFRTYSVFILLCCVAGSHARHVYSALIAIRCVAGSQAIRTYLLCLGSDMLRGRLAVLARTRCFLVVICCAARFHAFTRCHLIVMCYVAGSQASHLLCLHSVMSRSRLPGLARMLRLGSDPLRGRLSGFARTRFDCDALHRRLPRLACTRCYWR